MDIINEITSALGRHERIALATIISSSGSTPLPAGASMVIGQQGKFVRGTIGGGVVEGNVISECAREMNQGGSVSIHSFELSEPDSEDGMICGGTIDVLIERLSEEDLPLFQSLLTMREQGNDCTLLRVVEPGKGIAKRSLVESVTPGSTARPPLAGFVRDHQIPPEKFLQSFQKAQREEGVARISGLNGEIILQAIVGTQPLVIFGGGHIGRSLSRIAAVAGFTVTVVDDREEYARPVRFPDALRTLLKRGRDAFAEIEIKKSTSIVIVTRGHELDKEVLREAIKTPARYIGMIGSGKKVTATYDGLRNEGVPVEALKRVHAPIGLEIGAVSAEEIAVSIVAELIRARRGMLSASEPMMTRMGHWLSQAESKLPTERQG